MCTLAVVFEPGASVVLAANRDELYARPTEAPQALAAGVYGGRDVLAGGTWLALTRSGFVSAVTNVRGYPDPSRASRGALVVDVARAGSVEAAEARLRAVRPGEYNPFNLLFGDASTLCVAYARDDAEVEIEAVSAGIHVLPNGRLNEAGFPAVPRLQQRLAGLDGAWDELAPRLAMALEDPVVTVRGGDLYGTRSRSLVSLAPGRVEQYVHQEDARDDGAYQDWTWLVS